MQELLNKLKELREYNEFDKKFFSVTDELRHRNEDNHHDMNLATTHAERAIAKEKYLLDMADGLIVEATFFNNANKLHIVLEEIFALVDALPAENN